MIKLPSHFLSLPLTVLLTLAPSLWLAPVVLPTLAQTVVESKAEADRLLEEGIRLLEQREYQTAIKKLQQAQVIWEEIGDRSTVGTVLNNIGVAYRRLGEYSTALEYFQKALAIRREVGDRSGEEITLSNMGLVYDSLSQYQKALELYQQALVITRELGDKPNEAATLYKLGSAYKSLGQYPKALESYQQARTIWEEIEDRSAVGTVLNGIGSTYNRLGEYSTALEYFQKALAIRREVGDRSGEGITLSNMGLVYDSLSQYQKALELYQQALVIAREVGDKTNEAVGLHNLGSVYKSLGQYPKALEFYQQALAIAREMGNRSSESTTLSNLGLVYSSLGQDLRSLELYQQALVIAREVGDRNLEGSVLNNLGFAYRNLGKHSQALEDYQQALVIAREIGNRNGEGIILSNIGYLLKKENQPQLAIVFFKQSVNVTEAIRQDLRVLSQEDQKAFTGSIADSYRTLADLLLQQDRILEAQQVLDLLKVQELDDFLKQVRGNQTTAKGIDTLAPEQQVLAKYGELQKSAIQVGQELTELRKLPEDQRTPTQQQRIAQLVKIQQGLNQQFNTFIEDVQDFIDQLSSTVKKQSLDLESLTALKDDLRKAGNAVLLYPLILDDRLELILTTPDTPPIRRTIAVKRADLNRTIVEFRNALKDPFLDAKTPAQQLYAWLIKPFEAELKQSGTQTIIYAPDGQLRYIPLSALFDGKQWLVERYRINNITAQSLTNLNITSASQPKVLAGAFAQGSYSFTVGQKEFSFDGLPGAAQEVQLLTTTLPNTTLLLDRNFSEDATTTRMNEYNILHFATHAAFVAGEPKNSFILFGDGKYATLTDVRNWDLSNVDLVVLSACETGLGGQFGNGEEVLGLGYVFQEKGARAVLASLWTVDDGGTQVLMSGFYQALKSGKLSKAEALRQAQLALIQGQQPAGGTLPPEVTEQLNHPYYWAPFILIGNGL